jgi:hypothetical protein
MPGEWVELLEWVVFAGVLIGVCVVNGWRAARPRGEA